MKDHLLLLVIGIPTALVAVLFWAMWQQSFTMRQDRLACERANKMWLGSQCVKVCP